MSASPGQRLTLFIPGLFAETPSSPTGGIDQELAPVPPALARLRARAEARPDPENGMEARLFRLFGLDLPAGLDLPVAAVTRLADAGTADQDWWIRADPVHLTATRNGLVLQTGLGLTQDEADRLVAELSAALAQQGWRLEAPCPERWYLKPPLAPSMTTTPLAQTIGRDVHPLLPRGPDAKSWHTHLNEFQILLHASPVNAAREARGALPANSVWFWGGGRLPQPRKCDYIQLSAREPLSLGLARLNAVPAVLVEHAGQWLASVSGPAGEYLVVLDAPNDTSGGQHRLAQLDQDWLSPLLAAVHAGKLAELRLLGESGPTLVYRRAHRWRFWRRAARLAALRAP